MKEDLLKPVDFSEQKAALLASILDAEGTPTEQPHRIRRRANPDAYPLSAGQRRMWFLDQFEKGPHYNQEVALRLEGKIDVPVLEKVVQEILRRHEATRSTLTLEDGQLVQRLVSVQPIKLPVIDLNAIPEPTRESEAIRLAVKEVRKPFDLSKGPLWRFSLFSLAEDHYILLIVAHHISVDGWSWGILLKELAVLYSAFQAGKPSPLLEPAIQYSDYAAWQTEWLKSEAASEQGTYWMHRLSGAHPLLELPTDRPRPSIQTFCGARHSLNLPKPLSTKLKTLSAHEGVTLFMTLLAAFTTLIKRYTERDDIVIGTPTANRTLPELEELIGFFVNTLVLRNDLSGDPTFRELLQRVRHTTLSALENQDLPFEQLVDALHLERTQSYTPLFQILFVLQNSPRRPLEMAGLSASHFEIDNGTSKFDLSVYVFDKPEGLSCVFEYNIGLFGESTVSRMAGHFRTLLESVATDPERRLSELPLLTEAERRQLLVDWNESKVDYPADACLHELFEAQAQRTPEAVALTCGGVSLTYRELSQRANQLAHTLREYGVGPDVIVGLYMERSLQLVIGLLGILKAGGAYLPIDLAYPKERVMYMLEDARAPVLLTHSKLAADLPVHQARVVCLEDAELSDFRSQPTSHPSSDARCENLAYVIYTSGTTGQPKGVLITHRNVVRLFSATEQWYGFNEQDVWTLFHSCAFDFSVWEIWGALLYGGRLVVVPYMITRSPEEFYKLLAEERVTVLNQTPSAFRQLIQAEESVGQKELALRYVVFGGEALEMQTLRPWFERHGDQKPRLVNMYGITETTVHVTYRPLSKEDLNSTSVIGVPIPDLKIYILDTQRQPMPIGIPGEMYVSGAGLARGYLRRPELTAERFVPDNLTGRPGSRLYRTGDLARFLPGRDIEYLGRIDQQVKIRGFRVELGEVEETLRQHLAVGEAVVTVRETTPGDKRLVAYFTGPDSREEGEATVGADGLRRHLARSLPQYMVPAAYVKLRAFPLTPNGKVDRKALPAPEGDAYAVRGYVAPQGEVETALAGIWTELLRLERVGVHDNFFDLGGHSLLAVRLMARIEQVLGKRMNLIALFQAPTIREQAAILSGQNYPGQLPGVVPICAVGSKAPFFWIGATPRYRPLGQLVVSDQPLLGLHLQPSQVDQLSIPYKMEELAACLVSTVKAAQPEGPYYLGGFCLNGVLAYEVARQLKARGENIALLLLFDAWNRAHQRSVRSSLAGTILPRLRFHLANLRQLEMKQVLAYFLTVVRGHVDSVKAHIWRTAYGLKLHMGDGRLSDPDQIRQVAGRVYRPGPYQGRVIFFQTSKRPVGHQWNLVSGWRELVGGILEVQEIPGDHESVFHGRELEYLASQMTTSLLEAQAAWDGEQRIREVRA
jgi:fengycin family lipopeptide synthetase B